MIDPGTWAAFFARHASRAVTSLSRHYRGSLAQPGKARGIETTIQALVDALPLAPFVRLRLGDDSDPKVLVALGDARALVARRPEDVTAANWRLPWHMHRNGQLAADPQFPSDAGWFTNVMPLGTVFEVWERVCDPNCAARLTDARLAEARALAPYNYPLAAEDIDRRHGSSPPVDAVDRAFAPFAAYDVPSMMARASALPISSGRPPPTA